MKFPATIQQGQIVMRPVVEESRRRFLATLKDGTLVNEDITKFHPNKTPNQLGAIFGLALAQIEAELSNRGWDSSVVMRIDRPTGIAVTKDMLKQFFYSLFPELDDGGKQITLSRMDTTQAARFFENIRNFAASQWSIVIPEPNPSWKENNEQTNT